MATSVNYSVIQPNGILTASSTPQLVQEFKQHLEAGVKILLIDLQNIDFIDSCGLGNLVSMHTRLRLADGKLYLCSPKDQARSLFDISDMDKIFDIFPNREEFVRSVFKKNMGVLVE